MSENLLNVGEHIHAVNNLTKKRNNISFKNDFRHILKKK